MHNSIPFRVFVSIVGLCILVAGVAVGTKLGLHLLGVIRFDTLNKGELVVEESHQQRFPKHKAPTTFTSVQRNGERFVVVGDLSNLDSDKVILSPTTQFNAYTKNIFGANSRVYQIVPSLASFYAARVVGSIMALIIGTALLGVAHDLWLIDEIASGRRKSWVLSDNGIQN